MFLLVFLSSLITICVLIATNSILFEYFSTTGLIILITWISWQTTKLIRWKLIPIRKIDPKNKSILITGCDSGFGYETARQLQLIGWQVFATVINDQSYHADHLKSCGCIVIRMNVKSIDDIIHTYDLVANHCQIRNLKLWAIVNNAGVLVSGEIEWGKLHEQLEQIFDVNVFGYVRMTRQFLPLIRQSKGRIINMSSIAGYFTAPGMTFYSMSKHAVTAFTDGLRRELINTDIDVIEIVPDVYKTSMTSNVMLKNLDNCWATTNDNVKSDFGDPYYHSFRNYIKHNLEVARDKPQEVVDAIIQSVTNSDVKFKYLCCGYLNYLIIWSFTWMPLEWLEPIMTLFIVKEKPKWITKNRSG